MRSQVTVVGAGYVGLAMALLLDQHCDVTVVDIDQERVTMLRNGTSPLDDAEIITAVTERSSHITWTTDATQAYTNADFIIVATPTDFNEDTGYFDTRHVDSTVAAAHEANPAACIVVKSTVPIGHITSLREKHNSENIVFSPEFLREGKALHDNYYPNRIIVGESPRSQEFADLLATCAKTTDVPVLITSNGDAEAIKLFSNTYLALRVSYFNEMDTFALRHGLNMQNIVAGVGLDPRIGDIYNNPSFGYGGYCLPKDSKQLLANFERVPQALMTAIVEANRLRKEFIARRIATTGAKVVGIYRLAMKADSDNFRCSSTTDVVKLLSHQVDRVLIFEPLLPEGSYAGGDVIRDFDKFVEESEVIVTNRMHPDLAEHHAKVFTRDLYGRD